MPPFAGAPVVEGVARQPFPYGLFSVLTPRPEGEGRWQNGMRWEPLTCEPASGIGPACNDDDKIGIPKPLPANSGGTADASPFVVYGWYKCSPVGRPIPEAQDRATAHLFAREEAAAENALWTGNLGNTPSFMDTDGAGTPAQELTSSAASSINAVALLEDFIAQSYGSLGVIHVTRGGLLVLGQWGLIYRDGARLLTLAGTPVVAGAGYPGTGPDGDPAADGTSWAYASPALFGYRSDVFTSSDRPGDLLDREVNDLYAVAERNYILGFDPCGVGAAQFSLGCCGE